GPLRLALTPVAALLSGFNHLEPLGSGGERDPWRCPVTNEPGAPALAVWLSPACPPATNLPPAVNQLGGETPAEPEALVEALQSAAETMPDVADLLVGRVHLADGLTELRSRWAGTDGVIG